MDEGDAPKPLRDLEQRLDRVAGGAARAAAGPPGDGKAAAGPGALGGGLRIGVELVVAVAVGVAIGWAFDNWFGTRPWAMISCLFLGIAAGMLNVYRAVTGLGMAMGYRRGAGPAPGGAEKNAQWSDDED